MTEQDEQQQLAGLEERYQWTKSQLDSQMPTNRPATQEELQNAANYTLELANRAEIPLRLRYGDERRVPCLGAV